MKTRAGALCLIGSLALSLGACASAESDDLGSELEFRNYIGGKGGTANPGTPGGGGGDWGLNGLEVPLVGGVDVAYALNTSQGMSELGAVLSDPGKRGSAAYIVECALPEGRSITKTVGGVDYTFDGIFGLAPEWENGDCDQDCQEWVTACLLARTNASGESVSVWMQSDHPAIGFGLPEEDVVREASWYGNLFVDDEEQFLCKGAPGGNAAAKLAGRTCSTGSGQQCGLEKHNKCDKHDRCDMQGPNGDVPTDCQAGHKNSYSAPYHTITTYLPD